jgi:guanylate kinase
MKSRLIILVAPSGAGKSTFLETAVKEDANLIHSVSYTTRAPRASERQGKPYNFISNEQFEALIKDDFFIEWAKVHDYYYGTSRRDLEAIWNQGKQVIMDLDVKGAWRMKGYYPDALTIFILPPSIEELRRRLQKRDQSEKTNIEVRLANAVDEMLAAPKFDFQIVNDDFERAYAQFQKIIAGTTKK